MKKTAPQNYSCGVYQHLAFQSFFTPNFLLTIFSLAKFANFPSSIYYFTFAFVSQTQTFAFFRIFLRTFTLF